MAAARVLPSRRPSNSMLSPDFSQNYFELFGLPASFELDRAQLHSAQQRLQGEFHPDRFVNAGDRQRRVSVQMAAHINQAYAILRDPVRRARYLLEINGADLPDESATTSDTAFLMEQLELREAIESCRDSDDPLRECAQIEDRLAQSANELAANFVDCFGRGDYDRAAETSRKMQFIQRLQQQLSELQFELEGV